MLHCAVHTSAVVEGDDAGEREAQCLALVTVRALEWVVGERQTGEDSDTWSVPVFAHCGRLVDALGVQEGGNGLALVCRAVLRARQAGVEVTPRITTAVQHLAQPRWLAREALAQVRARRGGNVRPPPMRACGMRVGQPLGEPSEYDRAKVVKRARQFHDGSLQVSWGELFSTIGDDLGTGLSGMDDLADYVQQVEEGARDFSLFEWALAAAEDGCTLRLMMPGAEAHAGLISLHECAEQRTGMGTRARDLLRRLAPVGLPPRYVAPLQSGEGEEASVEPVLLQDGHAAGDLGAVRAMLRGSFIVPDTVQAAEVVRGAARVSEGASCVLIAAPDMLGGRQGGVAVLCSLGAGGGDVAACYVTQRGGDEASPLAAAAAAASSLLHLFAVQLAEAKAVVMVSAGTLSPEDLAAEGVDWADVLLAESRYLVHRGGKRGRSEPPPAALSALQTALEVLRQSGENSAGFLVPRAVRRRAAGGERAPDERWVACSPLVTFEPGRVPAAGEGITQCHAGCWCAEAGARALCRVPGCAHHRALKSGESPMREPHYRQMHSDHPFLYDVAKAAGLTICGKCLLPYQGGRHSAACKGLSLNRQHAARARPIDAGETDDSPLIWPMMEELDNWSWAEVFSHYSLAERELGGRSGARKLALVPLVHVMRVVSRACAGGDRDGVERARALKLLFLVVPMVLRRRRRGDEAGLSRTELLQSRARRFMAGEWRELWPERQFDASSWSTCDDQMQVTVRVVSALVRSGELSRAARVLKDSCGIQEVSDDLFDALQALHPAKRPDDSEAEDGGASHGDDDAGPKSCFTNDMLLRYLKKAPRLSSPDVTGWTSEILYAICRGGHVDLVGDVARCLTTPGVVPPEAAMYLYGARLVPLAKKQGGTRPIAVMNGIVKAAAGAAAKMLGQSVRSEFKGLQYCLERGANERIAHQVRALLRKHPDWVCILVDISNGYNTLSRAAVRRALRKRGLWRYMGYFDSVYGEAAQLLLRGADGTIRWVKREVGVGQGDPIATLAYAIATIDALKAAAMTTARNGECAGAVFGQIDDVTLVGPRGWVMDALRQFHQAIDKGKTGLSFKLEKTRAYSPDGGFTIDDMEDYIPALPTEDSLPTADEGEGPALTLEAECQRVQALREKCVPRDGVVVLGVPVGTPDYEKQQALAKVRATKPFLERLKLLQHTQVKLLMLRHCAVGLVAHLARGMPSARVEDALKLHDGQVMTAAIHMLEFPDSALLRQELAMPLAYGGLALLPSGEVAWAAQLGAVADVLQHTRAMAPAARDAFDWYVKSDESEMASGLRRAFQIAGEVQQRIEAHGVTVSDPPPTDLSELDMEEEKLQRRLTRLMMHARWLDMLKASGPTRQALLRSRAAPWASAALNAVPLARDHQLSNWDMRVMLRLRYGVPLFGTPTFPCGCGETEADNVHAIICKFEGGLTTRHNALRDGFVRMLTRVGIACYHGEPRGVVSGLSKRSGGDFLAWWTGARKDAEVGDVTVVNPCAYTHVTAGQSSARHPLAAARRRAEEKKGLYNQAHQGDGYKFTPLAFEMTGAADKPVRELVGRAAALAGELHEDARVTWACKAFTQYYSQYFACELARQQARLVRRRFQAGSRRLDFDQDATPEDFAHAMGLVQQGAVGRARVNDVE